MKLPITILHPGFGEIEITDPADAAAMQELFDRGLLLRTGDHTFKVTQAGLDAWSDRLKHLRKSDAPKPGQAKR